MNIRNANEFDLDFIYNLGQENLPTSFTKSSLLNYINMQETYYVLVIEDDELAGYIIYWQSDVYAEVIDLVIKEDKRGKGYATALMEKMINTIVINNAKALSLEVSVKNIKAIKLYEKLGFTKSKSLKNYYKDSDAILYVKNIENLKK